MQRSVINRPHEEGWMSSNARVQLQAGHIRARDTAPRNPRIVWQLQRSSGGVLARCACMGARAARYSRIIRLMRETNR